jgi:hypothetical protein
MVSGYGAAAALIVMTFALVLMVGNIKVTADGIMCLGLGMLVASICVFVLEKIFGLP